VALAAGRSTRFGALKQVAPATPGGASLLACTALDALRGGFDRVAVVVREEIRRRVADHLHAHLGGRAPLRWIVQPDPLGTAHAVVVADATLGAPAALGVANGDDLYGPEALALLAGTARRLAARSTSEAARGALVGYRMAATLSHAGGVSRGWVETGAAGSAGADVERVREYLEVHRTPGGLEGRPVTARGVAGPPAPLPDDAVASMNLWALDRGGLDLLAEGVAGPGTETGPGGAAGPVGDRGRDRVDPGVRAAELSLAPVLDAACRAGRLTLELAGVADGWIGLTFPEDLARVRAHLEAAHRAGRYPEPLARGVPGGEDGDRRTP
jgi:hypothetical protein